MDTELRQGDNKHDFPKTGEARLHLKGFSEVNMAGDFDGRKSTSSVLVFLSFSPFACQSQKQKVVAFSMCEAEYIVVVTAVFQGV